MLRCQRFVVHDRSVTWVISAPDGRDVPVAHRAHRDGRTSRRARRSRYTARTLVTGIDHFMLTQPRIQEILRLLDAQQRVKASDLAALLLVSEETIRRDFKYLESIGKLRRIHGGAIAPRSSEEQPLQVRSRLQTKAKTQIATCAAGFVQEGMAIFLDTGTTTFAMAQALTRFSRLRIVTNSLDIAQLVAQQSDNHVVVTPGDVRRNDNALIGPHTLEFSGQFHYDIAFMGIGGIDLELGFMDYEEPEAVLRRTLARHCVRSVILADYGKFGHRTFINTLPFSAVTTLVTNLPPPGDYRQRMEQEHVDILYP